MGLRDQPVGGCSRRGPTSTAFSARMVTRDAGCRTPIPPGRHSTHVRTGPDGTDPLRVGIEVVLTAATAWLTPL